MLKETSAAPEDPGLADLKLMAATGIKPPSELAAPLAAAAAAAAMDGSRHTALFRDKLRQKLEATGGLTLGGRLVHAHASSSGGDSAASSSTVGRRGGRRKAASAPAAAAAAKTAVKEQQQQQQQEKKKSSVDPMAEGSVDHHRPLSPVLLTEAEAEAAGADYMGLGLGFDFSCGGGPMTVDGLTIEVPMPGAGGVGAPEDGTHTHLSLLSPHEHQSMLGHPPLPLPSPNSSAGSVVSARSSSTAGSRKRKKKELQQQQQQGSGSATATGAAGGPLSSLASLLNIDTTHQAAGPVGHAPPEAATPPAKRKPNGPPRRPRSHNKSCSKLDNPNPLSATAMMMMAATGAGDVAPTGARAADAGGDMMGMGMGREETQALAALFEGLPPTLDFSYLPAVPPAPAAAAAMHAVPAAPAAATAAPAAMELADFEEALQASMSSAACVGVWPPAPSPGKAQAQMQHAQHVQAHHRPVSAHDFEMALAALNAGGLGGVLDDQLFAPSTYGF